MNNIYVDELPKSCRGCLFQCYGSCLGGSDILNGDPYTGICHLKRQKPTDCPLKLLSDRLAEERKQVCEQIYKLFTNESMWKTMKDWWLHSGTCRELKLVLDAVANEKTNKEIIEQFSIDREYFALLNKIKRGE